MSLSTKNKWLVGAIILLLLLNIVTIAMLWFGPNHRPPRRPPQGAAAEFIIHEVGLDAKQQQEYRALIEEHQQRSRELQQEVRMAKDRFFEQLSANDSSSTIVKQASDAVMQKIQQLDMITFEHFKKVRAICRPDQQKKFDAIIREAIGMMGPGRERDERVRMKD